MIEHTKACLKKQAARKTAQDAWRARWPNACSHCDANTACDDPCPHCLAILTCPRCGQPNAMDDFDAEIPCGNCGYVEGYDAGCPADYVCDCRVAKLAEAEREFQRTYADYQDADRRLAELRRKASK